MAELDCKWCGGTYDPADDSGCDRDTFIDVAVERSQAEILADLAEGVVNSKGDTMTADAIGSFSDLHDYVDANCYGGLCDDDYPFVIASDDDPSDAIQNAVDAWLRAGGHLPKVDS